MINLPFYAVAVLLFLGFYGLAFKRNLVKVVISISIIEAAVNLFIVSLGYVEGGVAPIYTLAPSEKMVFPTPQALVLTSIVVGLAITALMLSLIVRMYRDYGTLDTSNIRRLKR